MSQEGERESEEKTELQILEEQLRELEHLSVRPGSDAAKECRNFITIVMCTFAPPKLAVVMNALLTFPEMTRVTTKELSEKMNLDRKQMKEYLSRLKALGYVVETTGMTEWAEKTQHINTANRYRGSGKEALYHIDYKYFIMMTHFRLYQILKRLDVREGDEDDTGYVCTNSQCYLCYKIRKIMDLILEQQTKRSAGGVDHHFTCSECRGPLTDAQKFWDNQNAKLTKKMQFNRQIKSLRSLLTAIQENVNREGEAMSVKIRKLENKMEVLRERGDCAVYQAATLRQSDGTKGLWASTGLAHLDRIGRRVATKNFLCQIDGDGRTPNEAEDEENAERKEPAVLSNADLVRKERQIRNAMAQILPFEIGVRGKKVVEEEPVDLSLYSAVRVMVNDKELSIEEILRDPDRFERAMTDRQWILYQRRLDELGLLEIE